MRKVKARWNGKEEKKGNDERGKQGMRKRNERKGKVGRTRGGKKIR